MHYRIEFGIPEIRDFYDDLRLRAKTGKLSKSEIRIFKLFSKAITFLESNPLHNSLSSHENNNLSSKYSKQHGLKIKVWQSYLENNTPAAGRLYWVYGPVKGVITIIGIEPHPEDKKSSGYAKVTLSDLPDLD